MFITHVEFGETFKGLWQDSQGRILHIFEKEGLKVSVFSIPQNSYFRQEHLSTVRETKNLVSSLHSKDDFVFLAVEVGSFQIGPIYKLYPAYRGSDKMVHLALLNEAEEINLLIPEVGMGLYDDYEEDFGIPWAIPLSPYEKIKEDREGIFMDILGSSE